MFPISRDPPEGGTLKVRNPINEVLFVKFPISRDPPEGGTVVVCSLRQIEKPVSNF